MAGILDKIHAYAQSSLLPWGETGTIISNEAISMLAQQNTIPGHVVERQALAKSIYPLRYLRNMQSITIKGQQRLLESTVAQVGLGGLGGNLLEQFLRMGIGTIHAADGDHFEESNLNRQELSTLNTLNQSKAYAAIKRAEKVNPSVEFSATEEFLTVNSLPDFLAGADIVIDALGGLETRLHLQQSAAKAEVPLITGALAGWTGYVSVVIPGEIGPADIMGVNNEAEGILGCPAPSVMLIASLMAAETIKILTDTHPTLQGKMLVVDLASSTFETVIL
ncbi:thiazole biosynthesis protein ThiF [Pseudodesulfovibrio nedwellii]|uniref:Thiazole biosynthesis protein ThiF n=1 Tax=Pseudodesulfovibrio nedwellii TaxID=2973072 RepID=A0ABM8AYB7_9BACT|nr:HesA/MoeB/ThiF family protein [Pseudodesulfovibrio nedwellii]BDQ36511.1 thiazole biosynthesis protein ThiF [Pseudodesulfovibrio nedwellii]